MHAVMWRGLECVGCRACWAHPQTAPRPASGTGLGCGRDTTRAAGDPQHKMLKGPSGEREMKCTGHAREEVQRACMSKAGHQG